MLERPFRLEVGPYWILLPGQATVSAEVPKPVPQADQVAMTQWIATVGRFQILIHLEAIEGLEGLKSFTDFTTKSDVSTPSISVNGVAGVTYGDYGPPRTWIDWWFKKGDVMICLCLQSVAFPCTLPNAQEVAEHEAIIASLKYAPDHRAEPPPAGTGWG